MQRAFSSFSFTAEVRAISKDALKTSAINDPAETFS